ncbi:MAG TPA: exodeoxyribonuclease VII large subunit [Ruminococcaceae bacterium]|nr:exodeoxyribonuclease VII large subunit [Oscillospiraceae bacterium]
MLNAMYIKGEISNFTNHYKSGHYYFTLKDEQSSVKAVMFSRYASNMRFLPENGMQVIVQCTVSVYERDGVYQLYVCDMQPLGLGSLQLAYEQLKNKLEQEGLFKSEYKKAIPYMPESIAVVTSADGAVLHDIVNILSRRCPLVELKLYDVAVQGVNAAAQICSAIEEINFSASSDVIILARGGGSLEDLWAFNEEMVARAVFASKIPVISAIGHETDYTICDFAADLRAPTPTAAAELAVPNIYDLMYKIAVAEKQIKNAIESKLDMLYSRLENLKANAMLLSPIEYCAQKQKQLNEIAGTISSAVNGKTEKEQNKLVLFAGIIESYNPIKPLLRGYSITKLDGKNILSVEKATVDDVITTELSNGIISSRIIKIQKI